MEQGSFQQLDVVGAQCYTCWYFVTVKVPDPTSAKYTLSITKKDENDSGAFSEIRVDETSDLFINAGGAQRRKFLLASMENFVLEALVATGQLRVSVGLDPATVGQGVPGADLWSAANVAGQAGPSPPVTVAVKTTDKNFHMATFYYVYLYCSDGIDAIVSLTLRQAKKPEFITHNHD